MNKNKEEFYQQSVDDFYKKNGKCCAGCDHWRFHNSFAGDCTKSKLMNQDDRLSLIGIKMNGSIVSAGHAITPRDFVCGLFEDTFDWESAND